MKFALFRVYPAVEVLACRVQKILASVKFLCSEAEKVYALKNSVRV